MIKTLIWSSNDKKIKDFDLRAENQNTHFFFSEINDTKFSSLIKNMKKNDCSRILKINDDNTFDLIFRRNSVWTTLKFNDLVSYWMAFNNFKVKNKDGWVPTELKKGKEVIGIDFPFIVDEDNISIYKNIIQFICDENSMNEIEQSLNGDIVSTSFKKVSIDNTIKFNEFVSKIEKTNLSGIEKTNSSFENDTLVINTKFGEIRISLSNDEVFISSYLKSQKNYVAELFSFSKGILFNIESHLLQNEITTNVPRKIKPKDTIKWIISFLIIAILLYATFAFILNPQNTQTALTIIFSKYTWSHQWIYLMIVNFLISLFYGPLIGVIIFKLSNPKQKIKWSSYGQFFIAGQIRMVTVFLTGNAILATIFWAWYMTSVTKVKTVSVVGMVASMSILRGIMLFPIGLFFMVRGSFFNATILNEMNMTSELASVIALSWVGWIWHIIHNLSISLLIIMPPLHIIYNKFLLIKYSNNKNTENVTTKLTSFEMNLIQLKTSFKNIFKNKDRFYRVTIFILLNIIVETFEFTFALRIVEDYAVDVMQMPGLVKANYWNILAISSVRYMSGFVYHVPILNLLPGQGVGTTDLVLKISTVGVINHAHIGERVDATIINDLGEQTTFVMRFFNFYLRRLIALILSTTFVIIAILNRSKK